MNKLFYKPDIPFNQVFRHLTPRDFAYLFQNECIQTVAFILSFCRKRSYIRQVLQIYNSEDVTQTVSDYLKHCQESTLDMDFTRMIEKFCEGQIVYYRNHANSHNLRRNIGNVIPRKLGERKSKRIDAIKEQMRDIVKSVDRIHEDIRRYLERREEAGKRESNNKPKKKTHTGSAFEIDALLKGL